MSEVFFHIRQTCNDELHFLIQNLFVFSELSTSFFMHFTISLRVGRLLPLNISNMRKNRSIRTEIRRWRFFFKKQFIFLSFSRPSPSPFFSLLPYRKCRFPSVSSLLPSSPTDHTGGLGNNGVGV